MGRILITGTTGHVGSAVVKELLGRGASVKALVQRQADTAKLPKGVEGIVGDLTNPESLAPHLGDVDRAFLLPGYPGVAEVLARNGVQFILQLSGGSAELKSNNAVSQYMKASEDETKRVTATWTILHPAAFMSNSEQWAPHIQAGKPVPLRFPRIKTAYTDPADIGAVAAAILSDPDRHAGKLYRLSGPEPLYPKDCIHLLEEVLHKHIPFKELTNEESIKDMRSQGIPEKYIDAFREFYIDGLLDESTVQPTIAELLGRPAQTYRQWAIEHTDL